MKAQVQIFLAAVMFLTRLPVSRFVVYEPHYLAASTVYFPIVGALVGALGSLALWLALNVFSPALAVLFSMLTTVLLTGAFHEDGLADSADGFGGGTTKERVLDIMKDSRIGTYGAVALWFAFTMKFYALVELIAIDRWLAIKTLVVAHTLGRASSLWLIYRYPYVRSESSTSKPFAESVTPMRLSVGTGFSLAVSVALFGWNALILQAFSAGVIFLCGAYFHKRIGGITGDALGAANQTTELMSYFANLLCASVVGQKAFIDWL